MISTKKTLFIILFFSTFLFFVFCSNDPLSSNDKNSWEYGVTIKDTLVDPSITDVLINCPGAISIRIPAGTSNQPLQLLIRNLDSYPDGNGDFLKMLSVYDVTLGNMNKFATPLEITFPFDASEAANGIFGNRVGAAWYIDSLQSWHVFADPVIDTVNRTITIRSDHLTKLAKYGWKNLQGFTHYHRTPHFTIYWAEGKVPSNTLYISPFTLGHTGTIPHYIEDMSLYLEQAYDTLTSKGLSLPGQTEVYVQDISPDDGRASFLGYILINNTLKTDSEKSMAEALPSVCAHELLHISQDYYYMQLFSDYSSKWWLEATAVLADRMVWPAKKIFEAEHYADMSIINQLHRPWDDCNSDPEYYIAGGFLSYLSAFRTGSRLNVAEIIKEAGKATTLSYIRTILDNYIKTSLSGQGIGQEYCDYLKWAQSQNGHINLPISAPSPKSNFGCVSNCFLTDNSIKNNALTLSRLSAHFIKIKPSDTTVSAAVIKLSQKDAGLHCAIYRSSPGSSTLIKPLEMADSATVNFNSKTEWFDVLIVNMNKDNSGNITVSTKGLTKPFISSISPSQGKPGDLVTINGKNLGDNNGDTLFFGSVRATSISSWTNTSIKATVPQGAQGCLVSVKSDNITSNMKQFTITGIPQIISVETYSSVNRAGNSIFDLIGTGFGITPGEVFFGTVPAPVVSDMWGDKIIKVQIPFNATTDTITVKTANGQVSAPYPKDFISIAEYLDHMKEFEVYIAGEATFSWSDCNGGGSETRKVYTGSSSTGMNCTFSQNSYVCTLSSQNAEYKVSVSLTINKGATPHLTTISGTSIRNVYYGSAPDGTYNRDEYKVTFTNVPLYDSTQCQFGAFGPLSSNYLTSIDLKEYRWSEACSTMVVKSATALSYTDSSYRGDGIVINNLE